MKDEQVKTMGDDEFLKKYHRLVHSTINKRFGNALKQIYENTGNDREDLVQLGFIGLDKAKEKFKPEYGWAFSTYAVPMMIGEVQRALRDGSKIKVSRSIHELRQKIIRERMMNEPTLDIAIKFEVSEDDVKLALEYNPSYYHFSSIAVNNHGDGKDVAFEETLPDSFELEEYVSGNAVISQFFETISERDQLVWYLYNVRDLGQTEVAEKLGISQVQVSRLLKSINLKAAEFGKRNGLRR